MRVTPQHWEVFIEMCEKHPNLITGKFNGAQGKAEGHMLWKNVTTKLNGLGLGEKSESEWRRAVTDWKSKVKAKAARCAQAASQTGGGPSLTTPLTPLEERLIVIMGKKGFEGDEGLVELGFPPAPITCQANQEQTTQSESIFQQIELIREHQPSTSSSTFEEVLKNKRKHDEHQEIPGPSHRPTQEHDYCKKGKRLKKHILPRVSKNLETMTSESLQILKNIDQSTGRIANSLEQIASVLCDKFSQ